MKIGDFFDITKFGGALAAILLAAAIVFIINLGLGYNNKLVKLEVEHMLLSEKTNEEFRKVNTKLDNIEKMLAKFQPLLEHIKEF